MDEPRQFLTSRFAKGRDFLGQSVNLLLMLDITDQNISFGPGKFLDLFLAFFASHRVNHSTVGISEQFGRMPRDALLIGDPRHEDRLASKL